MLVGFHPHFIMATGMPTHFTGARASRWPSPPTCTSLSDHVAAGLGAGWTLAELREGVIDDRWVAVKPKWERFRHHPISVAYAWRYLPA